MPDKLTKCQTLDNDDMCKIPVMHAYTSELIIRSTAPTKLTSK